jgi:HTH-type transcriptional regulator/antitoxin HigA
LEELPEILIRARIAQGLTQAKLAELVGLKEQQIQKYESDYYATANLRRLQDVAAALKLNIREIAEFVSADCSNNTFDATQYHWDKFPVKEMYRRQWLEGFSGSLEVALKDADTLIPSIFGNIVRKPSPALYRRRIRAGKSIDPYSLQAWEWRVLYRASKLNLGQYDIDSIDENWFKGLVLESNKPNGPLLAVERLKNVGISEVVEPQLEGMHLDGAAMLFEKKPVIGLTIRYDRLDNFWLCCYMKCLML